MLSSLTVINNNATSIYVSSSVVIASNWTIGCSWWGSTIITTLGGVISATKMTVTGKTGIYAPFNGDYLYSGYIYDTTSLSANTSNFSGVWDGMDGGYQYQIPGQNAACWVRIDMPLPAVIKKLYHNCPATTTNVSVMISGSNNMGGTWTTVASYTMTGSNRDALTVPTIFSTTPFKSLRWNFANNLTTTAQIWTLDFQGDFYNQ